MLAGNLHGFDKSYKTGHMVVAFSQKENYLCQQSAWIATDLTLRLNEIEIYGHGFPSFRKYIKVFSVFGVDFTFLACWA